MLLLQKICIKGIIYYMKIREKGLHIMKRIFYGWFVVLACALMLFTSIGMVGNNFSIFMPFISLRYYTCADIVAGDDKMPCVICAYVVSRYLL